MIPVYDMKLGDYQTSKDVKYNTGFNHTDGAEMLPVTKRFSDSETLLEIKQQLVS